MANQSDYDVTNDTIFVSGLPEDATEDQLAELFGQIGIIKFDKKNECKKIWIYKDKTTGKSKGEATITYDDPHTASSAINWFDGKEFRGSNLKVELAQRKSAPQFSRGGFRGGRGGYRNDGGGGGRGDGGYDRGRPGGGGGGGGGSSGRPGDWLCPTCNNNNFAYRQECNRCKTQKPHSSGGGDSGGGGRGSQYNGSRRHNDNPRGNYRSSSGGGSGGGSNYRDNNRDNYRDRDRHRDGGYSSESRSGGSGGGGPSRSHMRVGRDDRRQRPY